MKPTFNTIFILIGIAGTQLQPVQLVARAQNLNLKSNEQLERPLILTTPPPPPRTGRPSGGSGSGNRIKVVPSDDFEPLNFP